MVTALLTFTGCDKELENVKGETYAAPESKLETVKAPVETSTAKVEVKTPVTKTEAELEDERMGAYYDANRNPDYVIDIDPSRVPTMDISDYTLAINSNRRDGVMCGSDYMPPVRRVKTDGIVINLAKEVLMALMHSMEKTYTNTNRPFYKSVSLETTMDLMVWETGTQDYAFMVGKDTKDLYTMVEEQIKDPEMCKQIMSPDLNYTGAFGYKAKNGRVLWLGFLTD